MQSENSERKGKSDTASDRIQELSVKRVELSKQVEATCLRDPDAYVIALVELQRCERQLGLLLNIAAQAQDKKLLKLKGNNEDVQGGGLSMTIFFLPSADWQEVHKKVQKIVQWKWCRGCIYAYEQKGTDELTLGHNAHVHIFVPRLYEKARAIKELSNAFKGLIYSTASVHVQQKPTTWLGNCQAYLTGEKSGALESVYQYDRLWRDRQSLPHPETTAADFVLPVD